MGRTRSERCDRERVAESLAAHGVPRGFAVDVADVYAERGPSDALVLLFAGGWELCVDWEGDHPREKVLYLRRCLGTKGGNDESKIGI